MKTHINVGFFNNVIISIGFIVDGDLEKLADI